MFFFFFFVLFSFLLFVPVVVVVDGVCTGGAVVVGGGVCVCGGGYFFFGGEGRGGGGILTTVTTHSFVGGLGVGWGGWGSGEKGSDSSRVHTPRLRVKSQAFSRGGVIPQTLPPVSHPEERLRARPLHHAAARESPDTLSPRPSRDTWACATRGKSAARARAPINQLPVPGINEVRLASCTVGGRRGGRGREREAGDNPEKNRRARGEGLGGKESGYLI